LLTNSFTIIVNDKEFSLDLADATAVFPAVREQLAANACARSFSISNRAIDPSDFITLWEIVSGSTPRFAESHRLSLRLLCRALSHSDLEQVLRPPDTNCLESADLSLFSVDALDSLLSECPICWESEDAFLNAVLSLGADYLPLLRHVRFEFLSPRGMGKLSGCLSEPVWGSASDRLMWASAPGPRTRPDSLILAEFPTILAEFRGKQFALLWRATRDGFTAAQFHNRCDGHGNTLTVIEDSEGHIFGAYSTAVWATRENSGGVKRANTRGFIFSVRNSRDVPPRKFPLKAASKNFALYYDARHGPCFGLDIWVCNRADLYPHSTTAKFGENYTNDTGLDGSTFLTGSEYFRAKEIEIFEISG
jgi:hypothetical protein